MNGMRVSRVVLTGIVSLLGLLELANAGQAGWYAGADAGYVEHRFRPFYVFANPSKPAKEFHNDSTGPELGVYGGYRQTFDERFAASVQLRSSAGDAEWGLFSPDEPAYIRNDIPYGFALSVIPEVRIAGPVSAFIEAGLAAGYVEEEKQSKDTSSYQYEDWIGGYLWAVGLSYSTSANWEWLLLVRETRYNDFSYNSHLPDGSSTEQITDDPSDVTWLLGSTYRF